MEKTRLKSGDLVEVITGDDKGRTGKIIAVSRKRGRLTVQGVNFMKKHTRANQQNNQPGGIIEREAPIHCSNVRLVTK